MDDKIYKGYLYDFYGELLNDNQRLIYEDYVISDLSYAEIAADRGVSRQAVYDNIKRCDCLLKTYEDKLGLIDKFLEIKNEIIAIDKKIDGLGIDEVAKSDFHKMTDSILNKL